jgi:hypothetical protein
MKTLQEFLGWELTTIVPHQGRLIAFFKRPAKDRS